jgi:hypothetical protein
MDSALSHTSERLLQILGQNKTRSLRCVDISLPDHKSLSDSGPCLFGSLEHLKATTAGEFGDDSVNEQVTKMIQSYEQTATSGTIRESFHKAGMISDTTTKPFKIRIDDRTMRQSPGFQAGWEQNISIDDLSRRRQM